MNLVWESEFGFGRPGWHIECSAMSAEYLGNEFDIHAGGLDLIFPHHENEIAQTCCAFKSKKMANVWMHNGYITVNGDKMSKSEGNFITVRDALEKFDGEVIRYSLISGHYRSPIDFSFEGLKEAQVSLDRLYRSIESIENKDNIDDEFNSILCKDLNTPAALSRMHELAKESNRGSISAGQKLKSSGRLLGLLNKDSTNWFKAKIGNNENFITKLIDDRNNARLKKDFELADSIREQLSSMGITN